MGIERGTANYSAQQLGEDVLAVIHELKLEKPIAGGTRLGERS